MKVDSYTHKLLPHYLSTHPSATTALSVLCMELTTQICIYVLVYITAWLFLISIMILIQGMDKWHFVANLLVTF